MMRRLAHRAVVGLHHHLRALGDDVGRCSRRALRAIGSAHTAQTTWRALQALPPVCVAISTLGCVFGWKLIDVCKAASYSSKASKTFVGIVHHEPKSKLFVGRICQSLTIDGNGNVTGISGTANGEPITGLASFNSFDNTLVLSGQQVYGIPNQYYYTVYYYDVDQNGLAFSANNINYLVTGTPDMAGEQVVIQNSADASTQTQTFYADYQSAPTPIPLCFSGGSRILTMRGEIAVENLDAGDIAITATGATRPVTWTGFRKVHSRSTATSPIRISAHAFGESCPNRDLYLSQGHPVLVGADDNNEGGHLVPIMCLINGTTIERAEVDEVTYWHVELDEHDILLAEGLPAESYIDLGSRPWFAGADGALYDPDMALPGMPGRCRPVAVDGPVVEAERRRIDSVFATRLQAASAWPDLERTPAFG